jgi:hypothetical protein
MTETQVQSQAAELFQKAHGKIVMLQRLDTQIGALLGQRKRLQEELNDVHEQINEEFDRIMHQSDELPGRILAEIAHPDRATSLGGNSSPAGGPIVAQPPAMRPETAHA